MWRQYTDTHNFKHCDLVQLQGLRGLAPVASNIVLKVKEEGKKIYQHLQSIKKILNFLIANDNI